MASVASTSKHNDDEQLYVTASLGDQNERYAVGADDTIKDLLKTIRETSDLSFPDLEVKFGSGQEAFITDMGPLLKSTILSRYPRNKDDEIDLIPTQEIIHENSIGSTLTEDDE